MGFSMKTEKGGLSGIQAIKGKFSSGIGAQFMPKKKSGSTVTPIGRRGHK